MIRNIILVVDDEEHMVSLLKQALADDHTEVIGASDGQEALDLVSNRHVDLIIADNNMPKILGENLFLEIKKMDPFVQLIMITGYPSVTVIVKMLEAGVSDFLIKPFDLNQIQLVVKETLGRIERWRNLRKEWMAYKKRGIE
ncbi:MAG: response regulator [Candidatus Omnitrophica bacterium]|nr:response regulator [Candidatus Omnitrophota bacterium]